ncbi:hypothetical protein ACVWZD_000337 [Streptomyces sp. TE3672]
MDGRPGRLTFRRRNGGTGRCPVPLSSGVGGRSPAQGLCERAGIGLGSARMQQLAGRWTAVARMVGRECPDRTVLAVRPCGHFARSAGPAQGRARRQRSVRRLGELMAEYRLTTSEPDASALSLNARRACGPCNRGEEQRKCTRGRPEPDARCGHRQRPVSSLTTRNTQLAEEADAGRRLTARPYSSSSSASPMATRRSCMLCWTSITDTSARPRALRTPAGSPCQSRRVRGPCLGAARRSSRPRCARVPHGACRRRP